VVLSVSGGVFAQAAPAAGNAPVTREEFNQMMKEMADLRQEVTQLRAERAAAAQGGTAATPGSAAEVAQLRQEVAALKKQQVEDAADADARQVEIDKTIKDVVNQARQNGLGQEKLLITGDAAVGFTAQKHNTNNFEAGVAPRLLWKLNDQLMFDAGFDIGVGRDDQNNNGTSFDLTIASVSYILNDYLVVGGGLFVAPFAAYHRDFDPSWITKLPDDPLVFSDGGLAPGSVLGAFISGAYPIGPTKVNYALYLSNGPELMTGSDSAGSLGFDNFSDLNNNKAVGGRVGFLPIPQVEIGYSFLCGQAGANGDTTISNPPNAFLQAVDVNYTQQLEPILGTLSLRGEWVWSHVGDTTYDPAGDAHFGPLFYKNNRNGGYVQVAYRPNQASIKELRNLEAIFRYDRMDGPSAAPQGGGSEQRYTVGLDYWLDARSVVKVAYEFDHLSSGDGSPAFMMQFGMGF